MYIYETELGDVAHNEEIYAKRFQYFPEGHPY